MHRAGGLSCTVSIYSIPAPCRNHPWDGPACTSRYRTSRRAGPAAGGAAIPRCHPLGSYIPILRSLLSCSVTMTVSPRARRVGREGEGHRRAARPLRARPRGRAHPDRRRRHRRHLAACALLHHGGRDHRGALQGDQVLIFITCTSHSEHDDCAVRVITRALPRISELVEAENSHASL